MLAVGVRVPADPTADGATDVRAVEDALDQLVAVGRLSGDDRRRMLDAIG